MPLQMAILRGLREFALFLGKDEVVSSILIVSSNKKIL